MNLSQFGKRLLVTAQKVPLLVWFGLLLILPLSVGGVGIWLLSQKEIGECEAAKTSPSVSDSTRLYCAQMIADRRTADDLTAAIRLANDVAFDHPLRTDADRLIERWSGRLLELGEEQFQAGQLPAAIAIVEAIPVGTPAYPAIAPKVKTWQTLWSDAEALYDSAQTALSDDKPTVALAEARKLLRVPNQYWSNTRFQELVMQIQARREELRKQAAQNRRKEPANVLPTATSTRELMSQWEQEQEQEAATHLAKARQIAANGSINSLRTAIASAELVFAGTSHYAPAQQLITEWTRQIETMEDRPFLDRANQLASQGDLASLQAAISEANNIYFGRALYQEAQGQIDRWTEQVRQLHDQQYSNPSSPLPTNQF